MPCWSLFVQKNATCNFRPLKWPPFPEVTVPLTPSNVATKFRLNNQNRFGEKFKNAGEFRPLKWPPIPEFKV